jgi:hypothetical protein
MMPGRFVGRFGLRLFPVSGRSTVLIPMYRDHIIQIWPKLRLSRRNQVATPSTSTRGIVTGKAEALRGTPTGRAASDFRHIKHLIQISISIFTPC